MTARKNPHFKLPPHSREDIQMAFEPVDKRVRVAFNHKVIADSQRAKLLLESGRVPVYYFPDEDIRTEFMADSDRTGSTSKGEARYWHLELGERQATDAAWAYPDPPRSGNPDLRGYHAFVWEKMDHWYIEDEEVFGHPRDPYTRIDIHRSSRHVHIEINGMTIAESHRPLILFETGLIPRYYLPPADVNQQYLRRSSASTRCPYKGLASYWHVKAGDKLQRDMVWSYLSPLDEVQKIAGFLAFYQEKIPGFTIDDISRR